MELLIKEQMRKYKVKMEEISQLEAAESIAFRRLSLLRQSAVSARAGSLPGVCRRCRLAWGLMPTADGKDHSPRSA